MLFGKMMKIAAVALLFVSGAESATAAADKPLRFGTHLNLNSVGEMTDAPWGVYADVVGYGATLSFDVSYHISKNLFLHSGVGLDYRYFASEDQELSIDCAGGCGGAWKGKNKDYLLYLEVPLLAQAQIPGIIYFEAGPVFDFLLMRKSEFFVPKEHRSDKCHDDRFFGAGVSIGLGHTFSFGLFIDAHLSYQLTDVVSVDKTCGSYTISWGGSRIDNESGKETVEKEEYIEESLVGSYYLFHKIQLGIGYWF